MQITKIWISERLSAVGYSNSPTQGPWSTTLFPFWRNTWLWIFRLRKSQRRRLELIPATLGWERTTTSTAPLGSELDSARRKWKNFRPPPCTASNFLLLAQLLSKCHTLMSWQRSTELFLLLTKISSGKPPTCNRSNRGIVNSGLKRRPYQF